MYSRTPDEIKQGPMCLVGGEELDGTCGGCAYLDTRGPCVDHVLPDVLALVEQLQATVSEKEKVIAELSGKIGQLEAERDAAVADLQRGFSCFACKNWKRPEKAAVCFQCQYGRTRRFEWRGVQKENQPNL